MTQPYFSGGTRVPSVTTVLGQYKDPGPLIYWARNTAMEVLDEAIHLLQEGSPKVAVSQFLGTNPRDRADCRSTSTKALTAGTAAHNLIEEYIHASGGERITYKKLSPRELAARKSITVETATQACQAFSAFLDWMDMTNFELMETEVPLVSEEYKYGGTIDCVGRLGDKVVILDWKTSKAVYKDYLLQLAAYQNLWNENWEPEVEECHLLQIGKETAEFHHCQFSNLEVELESFLLLRQVYENDKTTKKRC